MKPELIAALMALDKPWSIGRTVIPTQDDVDITPEEIQNLKDYPFFAIKGHLGEQFRVIGDNLEECIEVCLHGPVAEIIQTPPA